METTTATTGYAETLRAVFIDKANELRAAGLTGRQAADFLASDEGLDLLAVETERRIAAQKALALRFLTERESLLPTHGDRAATRMAFDKTAGAEGSWDAMVGDVYDTLRAQAVAS